MKRHLFFLSALALVSLTGCGGGGGGSDTGDATRELLAGTSEKTWRLVTIRGNANYEKSGADVPCAVSLKKLSDTSIKFSCGASDLVVMRTSGTFTYRGAGVNWSVSGSTVTLDLGSTLGVLTSTVSVEPALAGNPARLRLRQVSRVVGGVRNPDEDGCEIVIEEQAAL